MPRITDRIAKGDLVHPVVMDLLASEGPSAVSYRRVAASTDLTLAAIRNIWRTQDMLLHEGVRRLLPCTPQQACAHRALVSLRTAAPDAAARDTLASYEGTRRRRVLELVDEVTWLRMPARARIGRRRRTS